METPYLHIISYIKFTCLALVQWYIELPLKKSKLKNDICQVRVSLSYQLEKLFPLHSEGTSFFHSTIYIRELSNHSIHLSMKIFEILNGYSKVSLPQA